MLKIERREIPLCGKMKYRFAGKIYTTALIVIFFFVTPLFAQDYYLKIKKTNGSTTSIAVSSIENLAFATLNCPATVDDADGNTYNTIIIGDQCWMKENLNVGTKILGSGSQTDNGGSNIIEKYCYNNDDANCTTYGGLYQWNEAMNYSTTEGAQGICPTGWHIPTKTELEALSIAVGGDGNALKDAGQGTYDGAGTNTSGFSALFAGYRDNIYANFRDLGLYSNFWSSTESGSLAHYLSLYDVSSNVLLTYGDKNYGYSVRCLKD